MTESLCKDNSSYLDTACGGDTVLRRRVEALLKSHHEAADFLVKPAPQRLAEVLADAQTTGESHDDLFEAEGSEDLGFLTPSEKAGSLGQLGHYEVQGSSAAAAWASSCGPSTKSCTAWWPLR